MKRTEMFELFKIALVMRAVAIANECGLEMLFSQKYRKRTIEKLFVDMGFGELTEHDMNMLLSVVPFFDKLH